jgi:hypothetical protein
MNIHSKFRMNVHFTRKMRYDPTWESADYTGDFRREAASALAQTPLGFRAPLDAQP